MIHPRGGRLQPSPEGAKKKILKKEKKMPRGKKGIETVDFPSAWMQSMDIISARVRWGGGCERWESALPEEYPSPSPIIQIVIYVKRRVRRTVYKNVN